MILSRYEGVATQITENNYNWQWKLNGIYLTACGAMSIAGFLALKPLETKIGSRQVMVMALALSALSYIPLCDRLFPSTFVPLWAYIMSSLMLSFGYPTAQAMSLVLFLIMIILEVHHAIIVLVFTPSSRSMTTTIPSL